MAILETMIYLLSFVRAWKSYVSFMTMKVQWSDMQYAKRYNAFSHEISKLKQKVSEYDQEMPQLYTH